MVDLPRQTNYELAFAKALERVRSVPPENLDRLGVESLPDGRLRLAVLEDQFLVDREAGTVTLADSSDVRVGWGILTLHYLISPSEGLESEPTISFAQIPDGMGYVGPYQGRVIQRFLHTAGRNETSYREAARKLRGVAVRAGQAAYRFAVFPTFPVTIIWHAGDEERFDGLTALSGDEGLPPGATMLYTVDAQERFSVEDIVVMSELLVGRLSGKGW